MSRRNWSRRSFLQVSSAAGAGALLRTGRRAFAQDPMIDTAAANNHEGYEKISWAARPFPMTQVRLHSGPFKDMQERDRVWLYMIPNDRLLYNFMVNAGKATTAQPLGGWEAINCELRGHFAGGHYLSACALMYASTGDDALRLKAEDLVQGLSGCQQRNGYLSAFPEMFFDRLKEHQRVWAPFYTYHKIMAGHLDMYTHCGSDTALRTVVRMADWAIDWVDPLTDAEMQQILLVEQGGMNEVMFNLYAVTGDKKYIDAGYRFEHKRFFDPLASHQDQLAGNHSNTNIPKVIGAARGYEVTGDTRYNSIAEFFWQTVVDHHSFAPGGTSNANEGWSAPDTAGTHLGAAGQECCCSYNMLKLTRHLFGWKPDAHLMDYYEHLLWNVRAGTQNADGMLMYYVPTIPGGWKTFGTPFDSYWCCTGTGSEEYAKLVDTLYFHSDSSLYVNQFIASEVQWPEKRIRLIQETRYPSVERTSLAVVAETPSAFALRIRAPHWADRIAVTVNGHPERAAKGTDGYLSIARSWRTGDRVEITLPMSVRQRSVPGSPDLASLAYGPLTLAACMGRAGLSQNMIEGKQRPDVGLLPPLPMPQFHAPAGGIWVMKDDSEDLLFHTVGQDKRIDLEPLYRVIDERYSVYWKQGQKA
jgi:DUF1680 family protein